MSKDLLEQMIFPKIMQCSAIDLKLNTQVGDDDAWAWAEGMSDAYAQDVFLADVVPAVPAHMVFDEDWIPSMPCTTSAILEHREKEPQCQVVLQCYGYATGHSQRNAGQAQSDGSFHEGVERIVGSRSVRLYNHS